MKNANHNQEGFSLVETLVAITVLLIIIVGPMKISSSTAKSTTFASEQVVAYFLAQEGAELAQKARDEVVLPYMDSGNEFNPQPGWNEFIRDDWRNPVPGDYSKCFHPTHGCSIEIDQYPLESVKINGNRCDIEEHKCALFFDNSPNTRSRYTYTETDELTPYTRRIILEKTGAEDDEVRVISRVTWATGNQRSLQTAEVETYLYNVYGHD